MNVRVMPSRYEDERKASCTLKGVPFLSNVCLVSTGTHTFGLADASRNDHGVADEITLC
jgi:hypothetical protein